jgi:hypothetical protein
MKMCRYSPFQISWLALGVLDAYPTNRNSMPLG